EHIFRKRECAASLSETISAQVENIVLQRGDNTFTAANFNRVMAQELNQTPRSWYAEIYQTECRSNRSYRCFREKMIRINEEMKRAAHDMRSSVDSIQYNKSYMYLCSQQEGQPSYCTSNTWVTEHFNPPV